MKPITNEYLSLVNRVREIDEDAANYLMFSAPQLSSFFPNRVLCAAFSWSESIQGLEYWDNINRLLDSAEEKREPAPVAEVTIFRIINRDDSKIKQARKSSDVAAYMLGRRLSQYIVVKSDSIGDRVVVFDDAECAAIQRACEES